MKIHFGVPPFHRQEGQFPPSHRHPPPQIPAHHWSSASLPYHGEANIKSFSNDSLISEENNFYFVRSWHGETRSHITTVLGPVRETGKDMNGWKSNGNKNIIILVMVIRPEERSNWVYSFIFIWISFLPSTLRSTNELVNNLFLLVSGIIKKKW